MILRTLVGAVIGLARGCAAMATTGAPSCENIAAGQGSARQVMAGWLASPGHCANIMNGSFTEMAAAYAIDRSSAATIYWTQVFASRQPPARR